MLSRAQTVHARPPYRLLGCALGAMIACSAVMSSPAFGQALTNDFIYQGELKSGGVALNGTVDLRFTLWDSAAGGTQIGSAVPVNGVVLVNGLVTATLNFGVGAFAGNQRWLQIEVDGTPQGGVGPFVTLSPRQPLRATPYALFALAGSGQWTPNGTALNYTTGNVSVGTTSQLAKLTVFPATGGGTQRGLYIQNIDPTNQTIGAQIVMDSGAGQGLLSQVTGTSGNGRAVTASIASTQGTGVLGTASAATGATIGLHGTAASTTGTGVLGEATAASGQTFGVWGEVNSTSGIGVRGISNAATGTNYGVWGSNNSANGYAGYFLGRGYFSDWLGLGRLSPMASTEIMGMYRNVAGFAGTFIETAPNGRPFYGYSDSGGSDAYHYYDGPTDSWRLVIGGTRMTMLGSNGYLGLNTVTPEAMLHVNGGSDSEPGSGGVIIVGSTTTGNISIDGNEIMARNNGAVSTLYLNNDGGDVVVSPGGTGMLICRVLQITGGADLSEQFEVNADDNTEPQPGMVVVIDPQNPGELVASTTAYDKKVAGVISGAGGVATGMMMGHNGTLADGAHAVALTGRVYCLVDAAGAAIEPGDMLTTSDTPGHAMKAVDESRSHGTIIGKAMTALPQGEKGLVLVLVNLQ